MRRRGPSGREELRAVRAGLAAPAASQPPAVEELVRAGGRSVPLRIHAPADGPAAGGGVSPGPASPALGIPAALHADARIAARYADDDAPLDLAIEAGAIFRGLRLSPTFW